MQSFLFGRSGETHQNDEEGNALMEMISLGKGRVDFGSLKSGVFPGGMGRGLFTTNVIFPGQRICSIDTSQIVTEESALQCLLDVMPGVENVSHDPWAVLALYVCMIASEEYEKSPCQSQYCRILPNYVDTILAWDLEDVDLLRGSHLHTIAQEILQSADATIHDIMVASIPGIKEQHVRWSLSVLLSRLVRLETVSGRSILALCPGLDFLNMTCDSTSFISMDDRDTVHVKSDRLYKPGDQVYINYGEKTSGELYISYGFYPDQNPHDACLFSIQVDSSHLEVVQAMQHLNIPEHKIFPLRLQGLPEGILRYAAIISLSDTDADLVSSLHCLDTDKDIPPHHLKRALGWLSKKMRDVISRYTLTQTECKQMLKHSIEHDRHHTIAQIMLQEHRILNKSMFAIDSMRRQM